MQGMIAIKACPSVPVNLRSPVCTRAFDPLKSKAILSFPSKAAFPSLKCEAGLAQSSATSIPLLETQKGNNLFSNLQHPHDQRRVSLIARASKDKPLFGPYPKMEKKPRWWWRSLACLPYLMNFFDHLAWAYAHPANNPPAFLAQFDALVFPLVSTISFMPRLFISAYMCIGFFLIVRRKELPHFFRFHVINGIMIGTLVTVIGVAGSWFPEWFFPKNFWCAATLLFLVTVLECMRCALAGIYPEVPFVRDGAYLYSDLNKM